MKDKIIAFIKSQVKNKPVVLGLSGGVDSAVVAYLAVKALGRKKIHCLIMPSDANTAQDERLAKLVCKKLGLSPITYRLSPILSSYDKIKRLKDLPDMPDGKSWQAGHKIIGNLKARIRMSLLYLKANEIDGLVLGTGNKSELLTGYFTKHGDGATDILPIGGLYKTEVFALAKELGVPEEIIARRPTAGLWTGQSDEEELGLTYENLDKILLVIEKKKGLRRFSKKEVKKVKKLIKNSEHKRKLPPICEL